MIAILSDAIGAGALFISSLLVSIFPFLPVSMASSPEQLMIIVGFGGQALFASRFIIQWIKSEGAKKSVIPVAFWYFSIGGGTVLLLYAIWRQDPVIICGQGLGLFIYARNLYFILRPSENASSADKA